MGRQSFATWLHRYPEKELHYLFMYDKDFRRKTLYCGLFLFVCLLIRSSSWLAYFLRGCLTGGRRKKTETPPMRGNVGRRGPRRRRRRPLNWKVGYKVKQYAESNVSVIPSYNQVFQFFTDKKIKFSNFSPARKLMIVKNKFCANERSKGEGKEKEDEGKGEREREIGSEALADFFFFLKRPSHDVRSGGELPVPLPLRFKSSLNNHF